MFKNFLKPNNNYFLKFIILLALLIFVPIICITFGSVHIDTHITFKSLINNLTGYEIFQKNWTSNIDNIIFRLRLPRILLALLTGAALSLIGILIQTLTKNSLADPYILGISSGASTGATMSIVLGAFSFLGNFNIAFGAFLGAILASFIVFKLSKITQTYSNTKLILTGVAVSSIFTAITTFVITCAKNDSLVKNAVFWTIGSLAGANYFQVKLVLVILIFSIVSSLFLHRDLDTLLLGEINAQNLGINTRLIIRYILLISTILTGTVVAFTGVIGFVGLIVPHMARNLVGSSHKKLIPFGIMLGGLLMVIADTIARTILSPEEIPIGVITAIIGAPIFLCLINKNSYKFGGR